MILIELNGERMLVTSLDGYDGATVIADNIDAPGDEQAQWDGAAFTVPTAVLKARKYDEVNAYLAGQFLGGFTLSSGPLAGHTLQTRDNTDRTNWLTSQASYSAAIRQGAGDVAGAEFRTAANETITCTYAEGLQTLLDMAAWGGALMGKSWTLKDRVAAMSDPAEVENFDVASEWAALP